MTQYQAMKNYLVRALAIQLEGETENLSKLHGDLKAQRVPTTDYTEVAEQLLDSTTALYSVVFDLVSTIWNINRTPEHPLKTFPKAAVVRAHAGAREEAFRALSALTEEEAKEMLAKLSQKTQAKGS